MLLTQDFIICFVKNGRTGSVENSVLFLNSIFENISTFITVPFAPKPIFAAAYSKFLIFMPPLGVLIDDSIINIIVWEGPLFLKGIHD